MEEISIRSNITGTSSIRSNITPGRTPADNRPRPRSGT
jgi:hypothetical protein